MTELMNILACATGGAPLVPVAMVSIRRALFLLGLEQVSKQTSKQDNKLTS